MAESKSLIIEDAPCMEVPPDILILALAFRAGDAVLDAFREGIASDISGPAADGGGFGLGIGLVEVELGCSNGTCNASDFSCNTNAFALRDFELPAT
jgi:hypothetical protein